MVSVGHLTFREAETILAKKRLEFEAIWQREAIKMHAGTWHWLPIPLRGDEVKFLVLFADRTEDDDMEIVSLAEPVSVMVE